VVRRWLRQGTVRRVIQGVFVADHVSDTPALRAHAVVALVPEAVVCGRTAALLWGVDVSGPCDARGGPPPVEVIMPPAMTPPRRAGCVGRNWQLEKGDTVKAAHITATTPLRTAADIGRTAGRAEAVATMDAFLHTRQVTVRQLKAAVDRFARHRGVRRLAEAVSLADGRSRNAEETMLRLALATAGVPAPEPGYHVVSAFGRALHRFAFAWPALRLGIDIAPRPVGADGERATAPQRPDTDTMTARRAASVGTLPAIRARTRVVGGMPWRVVECGAGAVTSHQDTVVALILRELHESTHTAAA
jgi:hypothetical protein